MLAYYGKKEILRKLIIITMFYDIIKFIAPFVSLVLSLFYLEIIDYNILAILFFIFLFSNQVTLRYNKKDTNFIEYLNPNVKAIGINIMFFFIIDIYFSLFNLQILELIIYYSLST